MSTRSRDKNPLWPSDNVSHTRRQVAGTPRPPSPLRKLHAASPFLRRSTCFHPSTRVLQQGLVRRAIRPVSGTSYITGGSLLVRWLLFPGASFDLRKRILDTRQVAGTPRPPSPLRKVHAVSAFHRRSAFFTLRPASYSSLVCRAIRPVPGILALQRFWRLSCDHGLHFRDEAD